MRAEHAIPVSESARADDPAADERRDDHTHEVAPDVAYKRLAIVNVALYGTPGAGSGGWVLIDAGLPGTAGMITHAAGERFGKDAPPAAIVLTHGHFDHTGVLRQLAERWNVPVFAHPDELTYLNGSEHYPSPAPEVGGGLLARLSPLFPRTPVDVSPWLAPLPADGTVPGMPGWRWIPTPGHSRGHVSLWRPVDKTLIVGDAFVTTTQESVYAAVTQRMELHGPPMYYTPDWSAARESVRALAALEPETVVTGHGRAMHGPELRDALRHLAENFDAIALPEASRYLATA
jgi:glyoxylase-like metal-dependent hydrolase (beta-lactamase superfamily II)